MPSHADSDWRTSPPRSVLAVSGDARRLARGFLESADTRGPAGRGPARAKAAGEAGAGRGRRCRWPVARRGGVVVGGRGQARWARGEGGGDEEIVQVRGVDVEVGASRIVWRADSAVTRGQGAASFIGPPGETTSSSPGPRSRRERRRSTTKGPNGRRAATTTVTTWWRDEDSLLRVRERMKQTAMKRMPRIDPPMRTATGMAARCSSGMAMPRRTRNETPSARVTPQGADRRFP